MLKRYRQQISKLKKELKNVESKVRCFLVVCADMRTSVRSSNGVRSIADMLVRICTACIVADYNRARTGKNLRVKSSRQKRTRKS